MGILNFKTKISSPLVILGALLCLIPFGRSWSQPLHTVIQRGHAQSVKAAIIDSESRFVYTGSRDHSIKMWDKEKGLEIRTFFGHDHTVNHLFQHGDLLASSGADKTARLWDINSGEELLKITSKDIMTSVAIDPSGKYLAVGGYDWHMSIWEIKSGKMIKSLKIDPEKGRGFGLDLNFSPDGKWLAIGQDNHKIGLLSTADWELKNELKKASGFCGGCLAFNAFLPTGELVRLPHRGGFEIWEINGAEPVRKDSLGKNETEIVGIDVNKDGLILIAGEQELIIVDPLKRDTIRIIKTDVKEVNDAVFGPNGDEIIVSGDNNTAVIYSLKTGEKAFEYSGILNLSELSGLNYDPSNYWDHYIANWIRLKNKTMVAPGGDELIRGKFGKKIKRWDLWTGKIKREYSFQEKACLAFDVDPVNQRLVSGGGGGRILLYDYKSGDTLRQLGKSRELLFDVRFSHDYKEVVAVGWDGYVRIYNANTGERKPIINLENTSVYTISFTPNDLYLVLGKLDKTLELWEPDTRTMVRKFHGHSDVVSQISFNKAGTHMLTSSWDGTAREWDLNTGLQTQKVRSHGPIYCAVYSPDEQFILIGGEDRTVRFFDRKTREQVGILEGHKAPVTQILFAQEGKIIVSVDMDGVTKVWDLAESKAKFEQVHIGKNDWMVRNPEGYFVATDGARQYIHFVQGLKTYKLDQFFDDFYRPDLIKSLKQGSSSRNIPNLNDRLRKNPPPAIKMAAFEKEKGEVATVALRVIDQGGGVKRNALFHNGKKIMDLKKPIRTKGDTAYYRVDLPLVNGINEFSAISSNNSGFESTREKVVLEVIKGTADSRCFIFAIGINEYQNKKLSLNYAKADASSVVQSIQENSSDLFKEVKVVSIFDQDASRDGILNSLDELSKEVSINDVFIFYYAGHGTVVEEKFFFVPHESSRLFDLKSLEESAISAEQMQEKMEAIKALKQIVIMDACQSGGSVELLAQRGAVEEKAIAQLSRSAGIHVMASAGSDQYASEFEDLGHGVFTYSLLEALNGAADGAPKDEKVTIYELKSFLDDQVPTKSQQLRGDPQYPYTFSRGNDFPLVIQKK